MTRNTYINIYINHIYIFIYLHTHTEKISTIVRCSVLVSQVIVKYISFTVIYFNTKFLTRLQFHAEKLMDMWMDSS